MAKVRLPRVLALWTVDEVAECIAIPNELSAKLWRFKSESTVKTPLGGDGTNGTVEVPGEQIGIGNDKMQNWWHKLTYAEKRAIKTGYQREYGHR